MTDADELVIALKDTTIAREVGNAHDQARAQYRLDSNTVSVFRSFENEIGKYYDYHYSRCVSHGGRLDWTEALGQAKEILEREYRRRYHSDIVGAFNDAHQGTNTGLRGCLDIIAEALKAQSIEHYVKNQFDSRICRNDFEAKVAIIRQFFARYGEQLGDSIQINRPERYAQNYMELIQAFVHSLQQTSSIFRRL